MAWHRNTRRLEVPNRCVDIFEDGERRSEKPQTNRLAPINSAIQLLAEIREQIIKRTACERLENEPYCSLGTHLAKLTLFLVLGGFAGWWIRGQLCRDLRKVCSCPSFSYP